jgi:hypothetical protein
MTAARKLAIAGLLAGTATVAAAFALRTDAASDGMRLSNTGRPVTALRGLVVRTAHIGDGHLLATRAGRALYRLDRANAAPCFGVGPADDVGNIDSATCTRGRFPTAGHPLLDFSVYEGTRHDVRELSLYRVEGLAADGVAAVEFLRPNGKVALSVPVSANAYATSAVPSGPVAGYAAVDGAGKRLWRSP